VLELPGAASAPRRDDEDDPDDHEDRNQQPARFFGYHVDLLGTGAVAAQSVEHLERPQEAVLHADSSGRISAPTVALQQRCN